MKGDAESSLERARALFSVGLITFIQGAHGPMRAYLEESVGIPRGLGATADLGYALTMLSIAWNRGGDSQRARRLHGEGRAVLRAVGDRWGLAFASTNEGAVSAALGGCQRTLRAARC